MCRKFMNISIGMVQYKGEFVSKVVAVATDGTAWVYKMDDAEGPAGWVQFEALPQDEPANHQVAKEKVKNDPA